ncbi:MAG: hypothetical protein WC742_14595 [Gallionellaceae bacterium]|jgi:hypothetical protein
MLQLDYNLEPDENGVYDGRTLAAELIRDAYRLLAPYGQNCPACTEDLFTAVYCDVKEKEDQDINENGKLNNPLALLAGKNATTDAFLAHRDATEATTRALLDKTLARRNTPVFIDDEMPPMRLSREEREQNIKTSIWRTFHDAIEIHTEEETVAIFESIVKEAAESHVYTLRYLEQLEEQERNDPDETDNPHNDEKRAYFANPYWVIYLDSQDYEAYLIGEETPEQQRDRRNRFAIKGAYRDALETSSEEEALAFVLEAVESVKKADQYAQWLKERWDNMTDEEKAQPDSDIPF